MATEAPIHATAAHNLSHSSRVEAAGQIYGNSVSTSSLTVPRGDVTVTLNYFDPPVDGSVPFNYVEAPPAGSPPRNFGDFDISVNIKDIRGNESSYNLDNDAFAAISNVPDSAEKDFTSDESIKKNYYPEVEKLLLENVPGSTKIILFDHTIRRANSKAARNPVVRVHIDQTAAAAEARVKLHAPEEAERLLQGRYRIINVWRPLNGPVLGSPLAFASSHSVDDGDLIPIEHRYPDRTGYTAGVRYNAGQEWHYLSGMGNDERLLLECFDSEGANPNSTVHGGRVPHTAFIDPRTPAGAPGRESIEVRALVFGP
jgi:hypothetical protein